MQKATTCNVEDLRSLGHHVMSTGKQLPMLL